MSQNTIETSVEQPRALISENFAAPETRAPCLSCVFALPLRILQL
jgi:hypothetical protein